MFVRDLNTPLRIIIDIITNTKNINNLIGLKEYNIGQITLYKLQTCEICKVTNLKIFAKNLRNPEDSAKTSGF